MSSCSYAPVFATLDTRPVCAARRRLATACVISALIHLWCVGAIVGGPAARTGNAPDEAHITVSLERVATGETAAPPEPPIGLRTDERVAPPSARPAARLRPSPQSASSGAQQSTAKGSVPETPDSTYYAARQLDVYPTLASPVHLAYSRRALDAGIEGRALLVLHIDQAGTVKDVAVVEAQPAGYFEDDARRAFLSTRFNPGLKDGRAVKSRVMVEVTYGNGAAR